jgi:amino acid transporter
VTRKRASMLSHGDPVLKRWEQFLRRNAAILASMLGYATIPPLMQLTFSIGPPWPRSAAVAAITSVFGYLAAVGAYVGHTHASPSRPNLKRLRLLITRSAIVSGAAMVLYLSLHTAFVYDAPDPDHQVAGGFLLQPAVANLLFERPGMTKRDVLDGAEWDAEHVWIPWTVRSTNLAILLSWVSIFICIGAFVSLFVAYLQCRHALEGST